MRTLLVVITLTVLVTMINFIIKNNNWLSRYTLFTEHISLNMDIPSDDRSDAFTNIPRKTSTSKLFQFLNITDTLQTRQNERMVTKSPEVKTNCDFPKINPYDPEIMASIRFNAPLTCNGGLPHLVYLEGDTIYVNHTKTYLLGDASNIFKECRYTSVAMMRGSDFRTIVLHVSEPFNDMITTRDSDEHVVVECYGNNNTALSRSYFSIVRVKKDLEYLLERNYKKHAAKHAPKEALSVLMIGTDGNSKQNFQRHMPKTRNFLLNDLNAIELHQYNKVGRNTYPNLIPMLTGKSFNELSLSNWTRSNISDNVNIDCVWSDFREAGYRTGVSIDDARITNLHCVKDFDKPPVDYYTRAIQIAFNRDKMMTARNRHCIGDTPQINFYLNYWRQLATTFNNSRSTPYFVFSFFSHLTHDDHNMASAGDHLYLKFLQDMKYNNIINNTVIIFFSDHGHTFGLSRTSYLGVIESRNPYFFFVFPPWFHRKYPDLIKVLKINQDRLTTNRDVYETLRDLVNFQGTTRLGDVNKRGISLFQEIPPERTCEHAEIGVEFCLCNQLTYSNVSSSMSVFLTDTIQWKLNSLTGPVRSKCAVLEVKTVKSIMEIKLNNSTVNQDTDVPTQYLVTIMTTPGDAIYEATVSIIIRTKNAHVIGDINRLNMYRGQAGCIKDTELRPFCFCNQ